MKLHYKTPMSFVLGLLVNLVLIIALEILLVYRFPTALDAETLSKIDPRYENCTIVDAHDSCGYVEYILVETAQGQQDLIPVKSHPFFFNRLRIYQNKISQNVSAGDRISQSFGLQVLSVEVAEGYAVTSAAGSFRSQTTLTYYYIILSGALTFLEQFLWEKLRGQ